MRIKLSIACVALVVLSIVGKNAHGAKAINPVLLISFDGLSSVVFEFGSAFGHLIDGFVLFLPIVPVLTLIFGK